MKKPFAILTLILLFVSLSLNIVSFHLYFENGGLISDKSAVGYWSSTNDHGGEGIYILNDGSAYMVDVMDKSASVLDPYDSYIWHVYRGKFENNYIVFDKMWKANIVYSETPDTTYYHEIGDISENDYEDYASIYRVENATTDSFLLWHGEDDFACYVRRTTDID